MTPVVMDNLKCLSNHVFAHASVDFIDARESFRKELLKSMKIAEKFKENWLILKKRNWLLDYINIIKRMNF